MNLKKEVEQLKSSPIFNISLSSKELFHSNFIEWMLKEYPQEMWRIFSEYTNLSYDEYKIKEGTISRELKHIDLMFSVVKNDNDKDIHKIIIENKVKSLAYKEQLLEYSNKFIKAEKILLSLSDARNIVTNGYVNLDNNTKWKLFTYKELAKELRKINVHDDYKNEIIKDYIRLIENLSKINDKIILIDNEQQFNWYGENSPFIELHAIRLDSFAIKLKCEHLAIEIEKKIINKFIGIDTEKLYSNASIVRSTNGEFRIYYKFNDRIEISIEVSAVFYRKMIHLKNSYKKNKDTILYEPQYEMDDIYSYFNDTINWFDFSHIEKLAKYNSTKEYLKFGETTRYRQCKLDSANLIDEIIGFFIQDMSTILIHEEEIINKYK